MNLFAKINSLKDFTNTEKQIINFINESPMEFNAMSVEEIAERCYVSKATIYRLCSKLGYGGLNELKMMITASISDKLVNEKNDIDFNRPFQSDDSDFSVLTKIRELYEQTIYYSSNHLDLRELHYSIQEIKRAKNVLIFIDEDNYSVAKIFKDRMRILGVNIELPDNQYMKISVANSSSKEEVVIYATNDPKQKKHLEFFKSFNGNNTKIILISPSDDKILAPRSTRRLIMNSGERNEPKISNFSSNLAFSFIFDVIYSLYFKTEYDLNLENMRILHMKQKNID